MPPPIATAAPAPPPPSRYPSTARGPPPPFPSLPDKEIYEHMLPPSEAATHVLDARSGMMFFGGVLLAVAGNVLVARRYGKRVMSWAVPKQNKHNAYAKRELYKEYWDPVLKRARWEAYFSAAAEEERQQAERLYAWMMEEREREELREKLHRFYHEKADEHTVLGLSPRPEEADVKEEELKEAFRRKAMECHPDRAPPEERVKSSQKFKEVNSAFTLLMETAVLARRREEEEDW
ncbi:heat shock protein [Nannochloropsis oceanica]